MVGKQKCHPEQSRCVFCTCGVEAGVPGDRSSSLGWEGPVVVCFSFAQPLTGLNSELLGRLYIVDTSLSRPASAPFLVQFRHKCPQSGTSVRNSDSSRTFDTPSPPF